MYLLIYEQLIWLKYLSNQQPPKANELAAQLKSVFIRIANQKQLAIEIEVRKVSCS